MNRRTWVTCLVLGVVGLTGCTGGKIVETPEQRASLAKHAGRAAALGYLAINKPEDVTAKGIAVVIDKVKENLTGWKEGGFIGSLPGIKEAIAKALPGEDKEAYRLAAEVLAKILVEELDNLFAKHADWKDKGNEVASIIVAFCSGASSSFEDYIQAREMK